MTKPAVFEADYYTFEYKKGLRVCRLVFEVPYERAKLVRDVLGDPPLPGEQVRVAIARLNAAAVPETQERPQAAVNATNGAVERTYSRSQKAALLFRDGAFIRWFADSYLKNTPVSRTEGYEPHIKKYLGITSKRELDTDGEAASRFDALRVDYELKDLAR